MLISDTGPIITAHDEIKVRAQALSAGAMAYLPKPFNDELFIKTVRAALQGTP